MLAFQPSGRHLEEFPLEQFFELFAASIGFNMEVVLEGNGLEPLDITIITAYQDQVRVVAGSTKRINPDGTFDETAVVTEIGPSQVEGAYGTIVENNGTIVAAFTNSGLTAIQECVEPGSQVVTSDFCAAVLEKSGSIGIAAVTVLECVKNPTSSLECQEILPTLLQAATAPSELQSEAASTGQSLDDNPAGSITSGTEGLDSALGSQSVELMSSNPNLDNAAGSSDLSASPIVSPSSSGGSLVETGADSSMPEALAPAGTQETSPATTPSGADSAEQANPATPPEATGVATAPSPISDDIMVGSALSSGLTGPTTMPDGSITLKPSLVAPTAPGTESINTATSPESTAAPSASSPGSISASSTSPKPTDSMVLTAPVSLTPSAVSSMEAPPPVEPGTPTPQVTSIAPAELSPQPTSTPSTSGTMDSTTTPSTTRLEGLPATANPSATLSSATESTNPPSSLGSMSEPTLGPTDEPTRTPTESPTNRPTDEPTNNPTALPTIEPTAEPTFNPTPEPTNSPTPEPTNNRTPEPTSAANPTTTPFAEPTTIPTVEQSLNPSQQCTEQTSTTWNTFYVYFNSDISALSDDTLIDAFESGFSTVHNGACPPILTLVSVESRTQRRRLQTIQSVLFGMNATHVSGTVVLDEATDSSAFLVGFNDALASTSTVSASGLESSLTIPSTSPSGSPSTGTPTVTPGSPSTTPTTSLPTVTPGSPSTSPSMNSPTTRTPTVTPGSPSTTPTTALPTVTPGAPSASPTTDLRTVPQLERQQ
ncbi:ECF subfamily RNA polymerase sigma-24 subunit [Seminavis robusta]|uniref:ECF subfamily RNA polymerase sigma-24 subunit n=1 Tax=Seminavis robusta TaxID=568900 RepID=A0A9N8D7L8_9STRA|nr:ECF subfamily RNA polymerase sigma-24 subunit [Seminavis robusta]|eukprot:Sro8_g006760.1 ECF subfamily RNA polymerase sigma-24 subunit (770) ;mRNA; f:162896-165205